MKKLLKWLLLIVVIVLIIGAVAFTIKNKAAQKDAIETPVEQQQTVKVKQVAAVDREDAIAETGNVEANEDVVISSKISGRVTQVNVDNGKSVSKDQSLIQLDNTEQSNNLITAQSNLAKSQIALQDKQKNYQRYQELYTQGAISLKDLEGAKVLLDTSQADADVAAASVANAKEALSNTVISSPISGLAANCTVTQGQVVAPGSPLMTVQDISSVYVLTNVEQTDISRIKDGLKAEVTVDAYPNRTFKGTVQIINPVADQTNRVFEVKVKVDNPDLLLKPGMFAKVNLFPGTSSKVLMVPQEALAGTEGQYYLFIVEGDHAKRQSVEIGKTAEQNIEITSGISQGQQVIVTNVNTLKDGDKIRIAND